MATAKKSVKKTTKKSAPKKASTTKRTYNRKPKTTIKPDPTQIPLDDKSTAWHEENGAQQQAADANPTVELGKIIENQRGTIAALLMALEASNTVLEIANDNLENPANIALNLLKNGGPVVYLDLAHLPEPIQRASILHVLGVDGYVLEGQHGQPLSSRPVFASLLKAEVLALNTVNRTAMEVNERDLPEGTSLTRIRMEPIWPKFYVEYGARTTANELIIDGVRYQRHSIR